MPCSVMADPNAEGTVSECIVKVGKTLARRRMRHCSTACFSDHARGKRGTHNEDKCTAFRTHLQSLFFVENHLHERGARGGKALLIPAKQPDRKPIPSTHERSNKRLTAIVSPHRSEAQPAQSIDPGAGWIGPWIAMAEHIRSPSKTCLQSLVMPPIWSAVRSSA